MRQAALAISLVAMLSSGCLGDGSENDEPDGHFVNYRWGDSTSSCINDVCTYGQNADAFSIKLRCRVRPELSWDALNWIHGSVSAQVLDDHGAEVASHTVNSNGGGQVVVEGAHGTWTLKGITNDANGQAEIRLTCK